MNPTKTEAIKAILMARAVPDLAMLYNPGMEVQVNVAQDGGTRIKGDFKGHGWNAWSDNITVWKPFRIPLNAKSNPEFTDEVMSYDLDQHVLAIGMTGWDWQNRVSRWVAFDFDAISGHSDKHSKKLNPEQLTQVCDTASKLDWVNVRKSTSGKGLHLYIFVPEVPTENHDEHAALGRAILAKMSALTGFDFVAGVDNCGSNMWVWHRKQRGTAGLTLIKEGRTMTLDEVPPNWRDHVEVCAKTARRQNHVLPDEETVDAFEDLCRKRPVVQLDETHKKLITWLEEHGKLWWWDNDRHLLITHTLALQEAHLALGMRGIFQTSTSGSSEQNCFCAPSRRGSWIVRRFTKGVGEHESWSQDAQGWTRCFLNRDPDLLTTCKTAGGLEDPKHGFFFQEAHVACGALQRLGIEVKIEPKYAGRGTRVSEKDGRLILEMERKETDTGNPGWLPKGRFWIKVTDMVNVVPEEPEVASYDDLVRHAVASDNDAGWFLQTDGTWRNEPLLHIKAAMQSMGIKSTDIAPIIGSSVLKPWRLVCTPFQPEYPGDREWNRGAAQLRFSPSKNLDTLSYPTWSKILNHCGAGLDSAVAVNDWCRIHGILSGGDYLKCWVASLFQEPFQPLPYLFMWSNDQNSGKSSLHEALDLLLSKGYTRGDSALNNQNGFNGELQGMVLCVIEETDIKKAKATYNRMKDWITSPMIQIHPKGAQPFMVPNSTHWMQCSNSAGACPIESGDTRITAICVPPLDVTELIPKKQLFMALEKEAPDFLAEILSMTLPPSNDRLNVPVIVGEDKRFLAEINRSALENFIAANCKMVPGAIIRMADFYDKFISECDPDEVRFWRKKDVAQKLPAEVAKGRTKKDNQVCFGNIAWVDQDVQPGLRLGVSEGVLVELTT